MLATRLQDPASRPLVHADALSLPGWVIERFRLGDDGTRSEGTCASSSVHTRTVKDDGLLLVSAAIRAAASLPPLVFQRRIVEAYAAIDHALGAHNCPHPVRIWNWIPGIRAIMPGDMDRYMVFNAGRFAAYQARYANERAFEARLAAATGVGHAGSDLVIHVVAADRPGVPIENARQVRSYRYSRKHGPMPPCFSRATLSPRSVHGLPELLVAGTASVCGEESVHIGDVASQTRETLRNLAHVVVAGLRRARRNARRAAAVDVADALRRFDSLRIYYVQAEDVDAIMNIVWPHVDHLDPARVEWVRADICRPELLVEIEGTASLA